MPANYVLLEKITVGVAGASSVTFSGIPQTGYTDLVLQASTRAVDSGAQNFNISFNGSSANFSSTLLYGTGSVAASIKYPPNSPTNTSAVLPGSDFTASTFGSAEWYIPNYTSSTFKSFSSDSVTENNATLSFIEPFAQLWSNTAAITSITLAAQAGNLVPNSTFYLYGVAKLGTTPAIAPKATGGDIIDTDGTYWYHIFRSSGTFTPATALSCDYLVVAGGGGGAKDLGGGGGAGGLRSTVTATGGGGSLESALSLASGTGYTVTIGAGGAGGAPASNGSNSVFSTITSTGGGRGGDNAGPNQAGNGGSGGGAKVIGGTAGTGTANQGFAGGTAVDGSTGQRPTGGGGGAGGVGGNGTVSASGNGGAGVATSISGLSVTYAGGGGGGSSGSVTPGSGGAGGGGAGTGTGTAGSGTANTGGGGGGADSAPGTGGAGGSGIVIVRYAV
jgi:hypothetical protein